MRTPNEHQAKKRFGQNFLHDKNIIQKIVASMSLKSTDKVLEIGPGLGALTVPLLEKLDALSVVELDRDLIDNLPNLPGADKLTIHAQDALKFDIATCVDASHPKPHSKPHSKLRLVGNLPYNISSPLIFHVLNYANIVQDMHFMLQKEVVERLAAPCGSSAYGRLSVMVQAQCKVSHLFNVSKHCFNPAPKVESAIVRLTPLAHPAYPIALADDFERLVKQAFAQRRKTLRNNLKHLLSDAQIEQAGINPSARPETLSVEQFVALTQQSVQQSAQHI